jgi:hypothetical protein
MSYLCYLCLLCIVLSNTYWLYEYHGECPIRSKNNLSFASTSVHPRFFYVVRVAHCFSLLCCIIVCHYVLSSLWGWCLLPFPQKWCSIRLCLQFFVGGLMAYVRYLYLFAYCGSDTYRIVYLVCFSIELHHLARNC